MSNSGMRQRGMSLIEVVVFIVVLGIGFAAILVLYNGLAKGSVDPLVRKQALALASSMLEEIELRGFTYCDPADPNVYTADSASAAACPVLLENLGPEAGETRYAEPRFDNVNDYDGFAMGAGQADPNVRTIDNQAVAGLEGYALRVAVSEASAELSAVDATDALRITVTVTHPGTGLSVSVQGYRLRYAPNSP